MDQVNPARSTVSTWDLLYSLGFCKEPNTGSDSHLSFDFGNLKLQAFYGFTWLNEEMVSFWGLMSTSTTLSEIDFKLPPELESRELCLALLAYYFDADISSKLKIEPPWLKEGRKYQHLLPWERERRAYEARPHCYVDRDWARVAFKRLAEQLANVNAESPVTFSFDGRVLTILCGEGVNVMSAVGKRWTQIYSIKARALRDLPKRLMSNEVEVSVWKSHLTLGNKRYPGISAISEA